MDWPIYVFSTQFGFLSWGKWCSIWTTLRLSGNGQEEFEFWWKFVFCVKSIGEVNSANTTVGVNLYSTKICEINNRCKRWTCAHNSIELFDSNNLPERLNVVGTIRSSGEIGQVKLNLVPSLIKSHWHGADERFYTSRTLIIWGSKSTSYVLVV